MENNIVENEVINTEEKDSVVVENNYLVTDPNNPVLRTQGRRVTQDNYNESVECIRRLYGVLSENPMALGVAAQQVGFDLNIFIAVIRGETQLFINPEYRMIKPTKYTFKYDEGCLSIPNEKYTVKRCSVIKARWQNEYLKWQELRLTDLDAVVFQHEKDHLKGILISDIGLKIDEEGNSKSIL